MNKVVASIAFLSYKRSQISSSHKGIRFEILEEAIK